MKLLIYLLGIIGSVGSLVYSFNFSSNNHFIFISCIIVGLLIYLGFNYIQGKKKFVIGSIIADGILLLIPSTMDCLTYITSIIIYDYTTMVFSSMLCFICFDFIDWCFAKRGYIKNTNDYH